MNYLIISVTREDDSTVTSEPKFTTLAAFLVDEILKTETPFKQLAVFPADPATSYVDRSPRLPIEDAMAWRQPDDIFTRLLVGRPR